MIRTLVTLSVLMLLGRNFLADKGVPVDTIAGHGGQVASAPFDWDRYDGAAVGLIALMGWNMWRKRPYWARFLSKRKQRKESERENHIWNSQRDPLEQYREKLSTECYRLSEQVATAMRKGHSQLRLDGDQPPEKVINGLAAHLGERWPGIRVSSGSARTIIDWSNCKSPQEELSDRRDKEAMAVAYNQPMTDCPTPSKPPF